MIRRRWMILVVPVLLAALILVVQPGFAGSLLFQEPQNEICYVIADEGGGPPGDDLLTVINYRTGVETLIGSPGTTSVEAIAFQPDTNLLYAVNADQVGQMDPTNGIFTSLPNRIGRVDGDLGNLLVKDVDGLAFDPTTGILWASERREATTTQEDLIFQINHLTGVHINDAFGPGKDYLVLPASTGYYDIDDITFDVGGVLYAIVNNRGMNDHLVTLNKATGLPTFIGRLDVDDMEGLTFNTFGQLMGTTGKAGPDETENRLYFIDQTTASVDVAGAVLLTLGNDYEAVTCLTDWQLQDTPTPTPTETATPTVTPTPTGTPPPSPTPTQPTPVELLYFRINAVNNLKVSLEWATAMEVNNYGFRLYRGTNLEFSQAQMIHFESAKGTSGGAVYSYTDTLPTDGRYYYWLVDVNTSGQEEQVEGALRVSTLPGLYIPLIVNGK